MLVLGLGGTNVTVTNVRAPTACLLTAYETASYEFGMASNDVTFIHIDTKDQIRKAGVRTQVFKQPAFRCVHKICEKRLLAPSDFRSIRPSVRMEHLDSHRTDFHEI
jgi:hypothetical protein